MEICAHYWFLSKDNLNLPIYPVLSCLLFSFIVLPHLPPCCTVLIFFLSVCLHRSQICSPAIKQTSPSHFKGWFPFILICWQQKYHWIGPLGVPINYTIMSSEQFMYSLENYGTSPNGCQVKNFKFFQISAMVLIHWDEEILKIWWPYLFTLQRYSDFIVNTCQLR